MGNLYDYFSAPDDPTALAEQARAHPEPHRLHCLMSL